MTGCSSKHSVEACCRIIVSGGQRPESIHPHTGVFVSGHVPGARIGAVSAIAIPRRVDPHGIDSERGVIVTSSVLKQSPQAEGEIIVPNGIIPKAFSPTAVLKLPVVLA